MSPKPILKGSKPDGFRLPQYPPQYSQNAFQHHSVHFPPSPALTRTFMAHSAATYDRSPIVVSQNDCALPARGCPGRTYFEESSSSSNARRRYPVNTKGYHPRAFSNYDVPPLVPDVSSESDESDAVAGFPPPSSVTFGPHGLPSSSTVRAVTNTLDIVMHTHGYVACDQDAALAFLPHSPSSYPYEDADDNLHKEKLRRRRDKKHESSADAYRISGGDPFAHAFSCLSISGPPSPSQSPPSTPKKKSHRRPPQSSFTPTFSNYPNEGCLGGF